MYILIVRKSKTKYSPHSKEKSLSQRHTVLGIIFMKEKETFGPLRKFGRAAKDPTFAFTLKMFWKIIINIAIWRIYSVNSNKTFFANHFDGNETEICFANHWETHLFEFLAKNPRIFRGIFFCPHPLLRSRDSQAVKLADA